MVVSRFELPSEGLLAAAVCVEQRVPGGDPVRLRAVARRSEAFAGELRRAAAMLLAGAEAGVWAGAASRAFVDELRVHAPGLNVAADRYAGYAAALAGYAAVLEELGPRLIGARRLLQQRQAELSGHLVRAPLSAPGTPRPGAELLPIAYRFKADYDRWADALDRCTRALLSADHAEPTRNRHGLRALEHRLAGAVGGVLDPFEQLVRHPTLGNVSACLGELNAGLTVLGLGLLFVCPPVATVCLGAATVLAVAQAAVDGVRRADGEQVSPVALGLEVAAAIPIGGTAVRGLRAADNVTHLVPGGGLIAHEGLDGGHTLAKHVGKTEEFLRHRLATEPGITGASTFYDRQVAEESVSGLLRDQAKTVNRWLAGGRRQLILFGTSPQPLGWLIRRGSAVATEEGGIKVILRRTSALGTGYVVHTAMVIE